MLVKLPLSLEALVAHLADQELHIALVDAYRCSTAHLLAEAELVFRGCGDVELVLEADHLLDKIVSLLLG